MNKEEQKEGTGKRADDIDGRFLCALWLTDDDVRSINDITS